MKSEGSSEALTQNQIVDRVVPFGKIVRLHGFVKQGVAAYKLHLHTQGASVFEDLDLVYISKSPLTESAKTQTKIKPKNNQLLAVYGENLYRPLKLVAPTSPLGARWQEAPALILRVSESEGDLLGLEVGLLRSQFPKLEDGELYLVDLVGVDVSDAGGKVWGTVCGFFDLGHSKLRVTNIEVEGVNGKCFEFPSGLIPKKPTFLKGALVLPGIESWANLELIEDMGDDADSLKNSQKNSQSDKD